MGFYERIISEFKMYSEAFCYFSLPQYLVYTFQFKYTKPSSGMNGL
jgi:hypothetical protein